MKKSDYFRNRHKWKHKKKIPKKSVAIEEARIMSQERLAAKEFFKDIDKEKNDA